MSPAAEAENERPMDATAPPQENIQFLGGTDKVDINNANIQAAGRAAKPGSSESRKKWTLKL